LKINPSLLFTLRSELINGDGGDDDDDDDDNGDK